MYLVNKMENTCESCLTLFPEIKIIVSQFKCGICYEFMKTPMSTSCGHSYCSICIRTWIATKHQCPTCQTKVRDESLRNNLALENCIDPYASLQNKLHEMCKIGVFKNLKPSAKHIQQPEHRDSDPVTNHPNADIQPELNHTVTVKQCPKPPSTPEHNKVVLRQECEPLIIQSPAEIPAVSPSNPTSTNQQRPHTDIFTSPTSSSSSLQNDGASSSTLSTNINKVACPVCSVEIPERNINIHLDKCLAIQDNTASPSPRKPEQARREPLKKMVYHFMSEKEIRKKLQEFCLSTKGNRTQLLNRLQRYTILYNSECDSLNPRPVSEIRKQIEKDEETLNKVAPSTTKIFRAPRNADPSEIEEMNKQYISEHKSEFDDLIRQVREREKKKTSGPSKDCSTSDRTEQKSEDKEAIITWAGTASKRNRPSDDDSDEFSLSKSKVHTSKSRRIDDSDEDDFFLPRSKESSQETLAAAKKSMKSHENRKKQKESSLLNKDTDSSSSGNGNRRVSNGNDLSVSPVLNRSADENLNPKRGRLHRKQMKVEIPPIEEGRPTRGTRENENAARPKEQTHPSRQRGRAKNCAEPVRTVSRTPSLSPSRLEGLDEDSETPEMVFESRRRASRTSPEGESNDEMDVRDDNLSQLVSLMNAAGDSSDYSQDY